MARIRTIRSIQTYLLKGSPVHKAGELAWRFILLNDRIDLHGFDGRYGIAGSTDTTLRLLMRADIIFIDMDSRRQLLET